MTAVSAQKPSQAPTAVGSIFRQRNFGCLLAARTLSVLGNGFGRVALAFGVLACHGATPLDLSIVLACQALPQLVFVLVGGVIADRMSRRQVMIGAELLAAASWGALTWIVSLGTIHLVALAVAAVLAGAATALFSPAMTGLVPELVLPGQLQQANAAVRVGQNMALLIGLSSAGAFVVLFGATPALLLNAVSFVVSAALVSLVFIPPRQRLRKTFQEDLRRGAAEFFSRQWLWVGVAEFAFVIAAVNALAGVLGPLVALHSLGGARAWSILAAAQAVGTVGGAGLAARLKPQRPILTAIAASSLLGLPMLFLAGGAPLWASAAAMCLAGVATDIFGVLWSTTLQQQIPSDAISRVSSFDLFGSLALAPLGLLVAGPAATTFGTSAALVACSALVFLSCAGALLSPQVRSLRAQPSATLSAPPSSSSQEDPESEPDADRVA